MTSTNRKGDARLPFLRPFFGFFGGKWRDTPRQYPAPQHNTIVEPFAGSAGYSLRYYWKKVVLCEKDPIIAGVWAYLIKVRPHEILRLPDIGPADCVDELRACPEAKSLIGLWLNRGVARPRKSPSAWMRDGIRPGSFWGERVRNTIALQLEHIRHWRIYNTSYEGCPVRGSATWFIDPPYQKAGHHYRYGSRQIDYTELSEWCRSRRGLTIVCENRGADWLPFGPLRSTKTTRAGRRSKEVVWTAGTDDLVPVSRNGRRPRTARSRD